MDFLLSRMCVGTNANGNVTIAVNKQLHTATAAEQHHPSEPSDDADDIYPIYTKSKQNQPTNKVRTVCVYHLKVSFRSPWSVACAQMETRCSTTELLVHSPRSHSPSLLLRTLRVHRQWYCVWRFRSTVEPMECVCFQCVWMDDFCLCKWKTSGSICPFSSVVSFDSCVSKHSVFHPPLRIPRLFYFNETVFYYSSEFKFFFWRNRFVFFRKLKLTFWWNGEELNKVLKGLD